MTDCKVCKSNPYYKRGWNCDSCQSRIDSVQTELASATWEGMGSVEREMWAGAAPLAAARAVSEDDYIAALAMWSD